MRQLLALLVSIPFAASAATIRVSPVDRPAVEKRLELYETKNAKREPALRVVFEDAGCKADQFAEQPVKGLKAPNLICSLKGETEREIVVGAHFDLVDAGSGVVDNWSGANLLPSLFQGLASIPRHHTFRFVGFSGEERGLVGSKACVEDITRAHRRVSAMVNMDSLAARGGTPVARVASAAGMPARRGDAVNAGHFRGAVTKPEPGAAATLWAGRIWPDSFLHRAQRTPEWRPVRFVARRRR